MVNYSFYEMAVHLLGELPQTSYWMYDMLTMFLFILAILVFVIPISLIFKYIIGG